MQPEKVIVDTTLALLVFERECRRLGSVDVNLPELFARIVAVCNLGEFGVVTMMGSMANLYRHDGIWLDGQNVVDEKILADGVLLSAAVVRLGLAVHEQIKTLGLYTAKGDLGYFYSDLLGKDLVLAKLPTKETSDGNTTN